MGRYEGRSAGRLRVSSQGGGRADPTPWQGGAMTPPSKTRTPLRSPCFFQLRCRSRASNRAFFALIFQVALRVTAPPLYVTGPRKKVGASTCSSSGPSASRKDEGTRVALPWRWAMAPSDNPEHFSPRSAGSRATRCRPRTSLRNLARSRRNGTGRGRRVCERTASQRWPRSTSRSRRRSNAGGGSRRINKDTTRRRGRAGRAAPTPGQRGDDGYAGMPPRSNVDASPEARRNVTGKPVRRSLAPALPCALRPPMNDEAAD